MATHYDYIIAGGGAAGLSLAYRLLQSPQLRERRVLLLDRAEKNRNDRTWCFWETEPGPFEAVVHHRWPFLRVFQGEHFSRRLDIAPFAYKMIRGIDFYRFVQEALAKAVTVEQRLEDIDYVTTEGDQAIVTTANGQRYTADWCFSSIPGTRIDKTRCNYLDQHFRGWFIRTDVPAFDPREGVFMDFRTPQRDDTRFFYVLPTSDREALVEIAIFSNEHLQPAEYDALIAEYLQKHWSHLPPYSVEEVESGNIPMTDFPFPRHRGRVVYLGMAGGDTRASSGYTFYFIQQRLTRLIAALEQGKPPSLQDDIHHRRHRLYDSIMLRVLQRGYYPGDELFRHLFEHNPPARLLRFLNGQTSLAAELALMRTMPVWVFARAMVEEGVGRGLGDKGQGDSSSGQ